MNLKDTFGRTADYLRIGLTDKCNLRCRYCMPEEGIQFTKNDQLLRTDEIIRLSKIFHSLGVQKVRITGGEPFVHKDIGPIIENLSDIFASFHITSNATTIHRHWQLLRNSNVASLNISIDTLDRNRFHLITKRDVFQAVMANIEQAIAYQLPVKLNVVVMKGINDKEILPFVEYAIQKGIDVRFIEAMPFNDFDGNSSLFMSHDEILNTIRSQFVAEQIAYDKPSSSLSYLIEGKHQVSIIPSYSRSLCGSCNRVRLTPKGEMLTCLYAQSGLDLKALLRNTKMTDPEIAQEIQVQMMQKKKNGQEEEKLASSSVLRSMTTIGG